MSTSELVRRFANGNGAIFVGAGLSVGAKLPSWAELIEPLRNKLDPPADAGISAEQVAGWYEIEAGRPALVDFLCEQLAKRPVAPGDCHRALASLPIDLFFTTNFDDLLERSFVNPCVIRKDKDLSSGDDRTRKQVVKVHGDLYDGESIVFTRSDYDHYLEHHPGIVEYMRLILMQRTVLFVGYSFSDRDLTTILSQVGRRLGALQRFIFAVLIDPSPHAVKELQQKYGVHVIALTVRPGADKSSTLCAWLTDLKSKIDSERMGADQSPLPLSNLPEHCARFIGRDDDVARVIRALGASQVVGIQGFPGTGKSALAIEVARRCEYGRKSLLRRDDLLFAHGIYIDARGFDRPEALLNYTMDKIAVMFGLISVKRLDMSRIGEKIQQVDALLGIVGMLIVIDHLAADVAAGLREWAERTRKPSAVLLVSQTQLPKGIASVHIEGLGRDDALEFLRAHLGTRAVELGKERLEQLFAAVHGNPQAMKMLAGQLAAPGIAPQPMPEPALKNWGMEAACLHVFNGSWKLLTERGKAVLLAASMFATGHIARDALERTADTGRREEFAAALEECEGLLLLERCAFSRPGRFDDYKLQPMTAYLARTELEKQPAVKAALMMRLGGYYVDFAKRTVVRSKPDVPYWNALGGSNMADLDDEWPTIRMVLDWSAEHDTAMLIQLLFLLVHFMDTRHHNDERIHYINAAAAALHQAGRTADEALFRIDALSWTLIEEGRFSEAEEQVKLGMRLVEEAGCSERDDLIPLALTWLARIHCERKEMDDARAQLEQAMSRSDKAQPWIRYRVHVAAGDIDVTQKQWPSAERHYETSLELMASYGGESSEILPRLGIVCVGNNRLDDATARFSELARLTGVDNVETYRLYARYGLAIIAHRGEGMWRNAAACQLEEIRDRLQHITSSKILLRLMDEVRYAANVGESV